MQILKPPTPGKKSPSILERLGQAILPAPAQPAKTVPSNSKPSSSVVGKARASVGGTAPRATGTVPSVKETTFPSTTTTAGIGSSATPVKTVPAAVMPSGSAVTVDPLYVPNEAQKQEADLVAKLPSEFPILVWDTMSTRLQQKIIQKSGLSPQDQWRLLNASTPLQVLSLLNEIQNNAKSGLLTSSEARKITDQTLRYSDNRLRLVSGDASYLPPLQKALWNRELDKVFGDLQDKTKGNSNGKPKTTPKPSSTPLPKPGPTPEIQKKNSNQGFESNIRVDEVTARQIQRFYEPLLNVDTSNLSANDRRALDLISRWIDRGIFTQSQLNSYIQELERIRSKAKYLEKAVSDSKDDATWGTEMINNQDSYSHKAGTFGRWGNIADNGCGAISINNANKMLGFDTEFGDLVHNLNQQSDLTTNLFGKLGMNPLVIGDYYRQKGAEVTLYTNPADVPKDCDAYIALLFYSDGGGHYVAAEYNKYEDKFEVYNLLTDNMVHEMDSLSATYYPGVKKTNQWIIWGIDSPINTNDGFSNSPIEKENQGSWRDL